jgi:hypothetical protein
MLEKCLKYFNIERSRLLQKIDLLQTAPSSDPAEAQKLNLLARITEEQIIKWSLDLGGDDSEQQAARQSRE